MKCVLDTVSILKKVKAFSLVRETIALQVENIIIQVMEMTP